MPFATFSGKHSASRRSTAVEYPKPQLGLSTPLSFVSGVWAPRLSTPDGALRAGLGSKI